MTTKKSKPKKMKLSEAMKRGFKTTESLQKGWFELNGKVRACPLGAAYIGSVGKQQFRGMINKQITEYKDEVGWKPEDGKVLYGELDEDIVEDIVFDQLKDVFEIMTFEAKCPVSHCYEGVEQDVGNVVIHLTDGHNATREQILDYIRSIETIYEISKKLK